MMNRKRSTSRYVLIKLTKVKHKEKILKVIKEKQHITYMGISIRLPADLPTETLQAGREWQDILKMMKGKIPMIKITLPSKAIIQIRWRNQKFYR